MATAYRFHGVIHYLGVQRARLELHPLVAEKAQSNPEIRRIARELDRLAERFEHAVPDEGPSIARGSLLECECSLDRLYLLTMAAQAMVDEVYEAFGIEPPDQPCRLVCDSDGAPDEAA